MTKRRRLAVALWLSVLGFVLTAIVAGVDRLPRALPPAGGATVPAPGPPAAGEGRVVGEPAPTPTRDDPAPIPAEPRGPHRANRLGRVPILLYHRIGYPEGRWTRTPEGFRADLEQLYRAGFRPVRLADYLAGRLELAPGYAPVILTFDDGAPGQFEGEGAPSPDSAAGILLRFAEAHPGFTATAVFFINADPFGGDGQAKVRWLREHGFEVENHTWSHADLSRLDAEATAREVGRLARWLAKGTGQPSTSVALPFGLKPRHPEVVLKGSYDGHAYHHRALLRVGAGPAPSPLDPAFDPERLPRIQVAEPELVSEADRAVIWASWLERLVASGDLYASE